MTNTSTYAILGLVSALVGFLFLGAVLAAAIVSGIVYRQTHRPGSLALLIGFTALLLVRACTGVLTVLVPVLLSSQGAGSASNITIVMAISSVLQVATGLAAVGLIIWGIFKYVSPAQPKALTEIEVMPS